MSATTPPAADLRHAALWRRFACMLYDLLPLVGLWMLAGALWVFVARRGYDPEHPRLAMRVLLDLWLLAVTAAYFVVSWVRVGQTIGMRAWKVKLLRDDGQRIGVALALKRFVLALLSLALLGAGFWYAWRDPARRTLHDKLCGTRMVRA